MIEHWAREAGKNGESLASVQAKYGYSESVKNAFQIGRSQFVAERSEDAGKGLGMILFAILAVVAVYIVYSPFIWIGIFILQPIWPSYNGDYFSSPFIIYGTALLVLTYLLSCVFEYYRARIYRMPSDNKKRKYYYTLAFFVRIIVPIMATFHLFLMHHDGLGLFYKAEDLKWACIISFVVLCVLLLKVKMKHPKAQLPLTQWAFKHGLKRSNLSNIEFPDKKKGRYRDIIFSLYLTHALLISATSYFACKFYTAHTHNFPKDKFYRLGEAGTFVLVLFLVSLLSILLMDRMTRYFYNYNMSATLKITRKKRLSVSFLATLVTLPFIVLPFSEHTKWWIFIPSIFVIACYYAIRARTIQFKNANNVA